MSFNDDCQVSLGKVRGKHLHLPPFHTLLPTFHPSHTTPRNHPTIRRHPTDNMTSPSPSEFLTFSRRLTMSRSLRYRPVSRTPFRSFAVSTARRAGDTSNPNIASDKGTQQDTGAGSGTGGSREHALDKGNISDPNVQSHESSQGREYVTINIPTLGMRTGAEVWERERERLADGDVVSRSRASDTGGGATRGRDERNSTERAKKDHPEAPDVVIGMQDERGGKGH